MADLLDWGESTRAQARTAVCFAAEGVVTCKVAPCPRGCEGILATQEVRDMTIVHVSARGQITLPAAMRRRLGIAPGSQVEVIEREGEVAIRPLKTIRDVQGVFRKYAGEAPVGWETERAETESAVAEAVARG